MPQDAAIGAAASAAYYHGSNNQFHTCRWFHDIIFNSRHSIISGLLDEGRWPFNKLKSDRKKDGRQMYGTIYPSVMLGDGLNN